MVSEHKKETDFYQYCTQCKWRSNSEDEDPCCLCMDFPYNIDSHKPVMFEQIDE